MKRVLIFLSLILLLGCTKKIDKFYLDDKYYGKSEFIKIDSNNIPEGNYVIYTYNSFCAFPIHCETIFKEFMDKNNVSFYSMPFEELKKTKFHDKVIYGPSILIIKDNELIAYLDAESDDDIPKYQDVEAFTNWITTYIYIK